MNLPFVSVIIPVKKINDYIRNENLPAQAKQLYKNFEVILLPDENSSEDQNLIRIHNFLRIIPTGSVPPGRKRAIGAENAKGEIIAFIDDDAYPHENWITKAVKIIQEKNVACSCGPAVLPEKTNLWEKVFDGIFRNPVGSGIYMFRFTPEKERYVDDFPFVNFIAKKDILNKIGDKDSEFWPGDDTKVCQKIVYDLNEKIYYHPEILVHHHRRDNLKGFIKQHMGYGFYRGLFFGQKDKNSLKIQYVLPPLFLIYLLTMYIFTIVEYFYRPLFFYNFLLIPLILYFVLLGYMFFDVFSKTKKPRIAILVPIVTFITHAAYGFAFMKGFFSRYKK